jgi:hypothetical protein
LTDLSVPPVSAALLADAEQLLLAPAGLDRAQLSGVLAAIHDRDVEFADLYFQHARFESWSLEEGIVKSGTFSIDRGVGVRAVSGEKQAYAYSDDISLVALHDAAQAVRAIGRQGQSAVAPLGRSAAARTLYAQDDPVGSLTEAQKVALLERLERLARACIKDLPQTRQFEAYLGADARNLLGADVMNVKEIIGLFNRRWPIVFVAASAAITVVWIGALIWFVVELLRGFSGI